MGISRVYETQVFDDEHDTGFDILSLPGASIPSLSLSNFAATLGIEQSDQTPRFSYRLLQGRIGSTEDIGRALAVLLLAGHQAISREELVRIGSVQDLVARGREVSLSTVGEDIVAHTVNTSLLPSEASPADFSTAELLVGGSIALLLGEQGPVLFIAVPAGVFLVSFASRLGHKAADGLPRALKAVGRRVWNWIRRRG